MARRPFLRSTTVLLVRRGGTTAMASDGQVTFGEAVVKSGAAKVKRTGRGKVLVGFAGGGADALALFTRFEAKLEEHGGNLERSVVELAKDWRTDRALRQLQAMMIVADAELAFLVSGNGDLLQPDSSSDEGSVLAIGSGGNYALAAARALADTEMNAEAIVRRSLAIAAEICVYTNANVVIESLETE